MEDVRLLTIDNNVQRLNLIQVFPYLTNTDKTTTFASSSTLTRWEKLVIKSNQIKSNIDQHKLDKMEESNCSSMQKNKSMPNDAWDTTVDVFPAEVKMVRD